MTATVSLGALTDIGKVRRSNQDVVCAPGRVRCPAGD